jgi:hypothetical protein
VDENGKSLLEICLMKSAEKVELTYNFEEEIRQEKIAENERSLREFHERMEAFK